MDFILTLVIGIFISVVLGFIGSIPALILGSIVKYRYTKTVAVLLMIICTFLFLLLYLILANSGIIGLRATKTPGILASVVFFSLSWHFLRAKSSLRKKCMKCGFDENDKFAKFCVKCGEML